MGAGGGEGEEEREGEVGSWERGRVVRGRVFLDEWVVLRVRWGNEV